MKNDWCFAPVPTARFHGLDSSLAWCRLWHNGPISATSSAITSAGSPVILRSLMIAARNLFPTAAFLSQPSAAVRYRASDSAGSSTSGGRRRGLRRVRRRCNRPPRPQRPSLPFSFRLAACPSSPG